MVLLTDGLPLLIELGLAIFCLIDCIQTSQYAVRNLPKWGWLLLIVVFPFVGAIAWLVAGRPGRRSDEPQYEAGYPQAHYETGYPQAQHAARRQVAPDDDPEFLRELGRINSEHERTLKQWEADLARREEELRRRDGEEPPA